MADRPILFSAPMVHALLREARQPGTGKTQTRRILKPQPDQRTTQVSVCRDLWMGCGPSVTGGTSQWDRWQKLRFAVGDRLWVKETWQTGSGFNGPQIAYRATGDCHDIEAWDGEDEGAGPSFNYERCPGAKWHTWLPDLLSGAEGIWRPSLFMPRWASRLTLLVTDVRVERLQDISEGDAFAEGIERLRSGRGFYDPTLSHADSRAACRFGGYFETATHAFEALWRSINGADAWDENPWVVAVTFTVHARNIDQLAPIAEAAE